MRKIYEKRNGERTMKQLKKYIPLGIDLIITFIAIIVYSCLKLERAPLTYVQILVGPMVLGAVLLLNHTRTIHIPTIISYLLMIHLVLALILGSAFNFYDLIPAWDMILHGYFGFLCSVLVFCVLLNYNGEQLKGFFIFVLIFFVTMGVAGLWEIYEFTMDSLLGGDAQRVEESILAGHSPVYDTMMDMIIAVVGIILFYLCMLLDKCRSYRLTRYLYKEIQMNKKDIGK